MEVVVGMVVTRKGGSEDNGSFSGDGDGGRVMVKMVLEVVVVMVVVIVASCVMAAR